MVMVRAAARKKRLQIECIPHSTTPSSGRVKWKGFGDGNVTDSEETDQGVASKSTTSTPIASGLGNCFGAGIDSRG